MKWLWLLLFPLAALGQASNPQYVYTPTNPNGLACTSLSVAYQYLGNIYTCSNGSTYTAQTGGGGGGTVTAVSGTTNQIDVATGTTTPVVSLDPAIILPGSLTAPSGGSVTFSGTGIVNANEINGTSLAGLATGLLKNTTATGVPSIAVAGTDYVIPSGAVANLSGGVANDIPYQTAAGATSFIAPVNNAVLSTNGSGVPSESNTLAQNLTLSGANTLSGLDTFSNSPGTGSGAYGVSITGVPSTSSLFNPVVYINGGGSNPSWTNESPMLSINTPNGYSSSANELDVNANGTNEAYIRNNGNSFFRGTVLTNSSVTVNNTTNAALILQNSGTNEANFSYSGTVGLVNVGTGGTAGTGGSLAMSTMILVAAAPTVSASQIGYGSTTAASSNCGTTPTTCIIVNIAGTTRYVPAY